MNALPDAADFDHLGFTLPELGYLLASRPGRPADAMRTVFGADSIAESTSLVDRGYLEAGQLRGEAAAIAAILTRATRWSVADVSAGDIVERGILVESEIGKLIARQRAGRTWWFIVLDPESVVSQVLAQGVRRLAHRGEPLAATVRTASSPCHGPSSYSAPATPGVSARRRREHGSPRSTSRSRPPTRPSNTSAHLSRSGRSHCSPER